MRISDWSSDVCSSDLGQHLLLHLHQPADGDGAGAGGGHSAAAHFLWRIGDDDGDAVPGRAAGHRPREPEDGGLSPYLRGAVGRAGRSEEHTSELQSLMRISYAVFCLKKKNNNTTHNQIN